MRKATGNISFKVGKIPPITLQRTVYPYLGRRSRRILVGPGIGRDAAVVKYNHKVLVFSTDPITGTISHIGAHSVHINANDIATAGARPMWFLCTLLLPPGTRESSLQQIMAEIDETAKKLGITVIGGHTEATPGLTQPVIAGFMVGEAKAGRFLSSAGGREGDSIILTKTGGIEGTAILANDHEELLKKKDVASHLVRRAKNFSKQISVVKEALAAATVKGVHALHDPTEGGVLNGLWELAEASRLGVEARAQSIPVAPETRTICSALKLDPLKLMSSGSLLVAVHPSNVEVAMRKLRRTGVRVSDIGGLTARARGRFLLKGNRRLQLGPVPRDELYKLA